MILVSTSTSLNLGTYLGNQNIDLTQPLQVNVSCNPSANAITITLPPTDLVNPVDLQILVADATGSAGTNNITVVAGVGVVSLTQEKIGGVTSKVIVTAYNSLSLQILKTGAWVAVRS